LKWYDGGGENGITSKRIFEVEVFFVLAKYWLLFLFDETLGAFLFPTSFFLFFSYSVSWELGVFDDIWGENHFFKNFFSISFNILAVDAYSGMELCTPTWLNHDFGYGGVADIPAVDAYSGVEVCTPIFLGEASKSFLKKNQNSNGHIP
jgi:hypothetical protein